MSTGLSQELRKARVSQSKCHPDTPGVILSGAAPRSITTVILSAAAPRSITSVILSAAAPLLRSGAEGPLQLEDSFRRQGSMKRAPRNHLSVLSSRGGFQADEGSASCAGKQIPRFTRDNNFVLRAGLAYKESHDGAVTTPCGSLSASSTWLRRLSPAYLCARRVSCRPPRRTSRSSAPQEFRRW